MSALPPKADIARRHWHVRLVPTADSCTATNDVHGFLIYSITLWAHRTSPAGISWPIALAASYLQLYPSPLALFPCRPRSGIALTKHCFQPVQMMLQLLDNVVCKGIVCINMAREQERSIARLFQMGLRLTETRPRCAATSLCHAPTFSFPT